MAEQSGFFNSNVVNGEYDRIYLAEHFAKYFASFIGNGVFGGKSDELMVFQAIHGGMKVEVSSGMAWINGFWYENTSSLQLDISVADGVLNRIDNIVVRWDRVERAIRIEVVRGTPAVNAVAPMLQRNADFYELKLAEIHVKAGITGVTQAEIVDTRLNSDVCGFVVGIIKQFDTTEFGKQLDSYISQYANEYKAFLEELELSGVSELNFLIERLSALVTDESAVASLALKTDNIVSELTVAKQTLGYSKKNLLPYPFAQTTRPVNGITFTDNGDGTITINGTATQDAYFLLYRGKAFGLGKFLVSSGIDTMQKHFAYIRFVNRETGAEIAGTTRLGYDNVPLEITKEYADNYDLFVGLCVYKGIPVSNVVFKPMVRGAEIVDTTWEPYKLSVVEMIQEDENDKGCFYRINRLNGRKEWLNPACAPGWEYPLVERWNNQPVYQMTLYAASLPNKSAMVLDTNAEWDRLISANGYAIDKDDLTIYPFPVILHSQVTPIAVISRIESSGSLIITTNSDASYLEAYITIKYTKSY